MGAFPVEYFRNLSRNTHNMLFRSTSRYRHRRHGIHMLAIHTFGARSNVGEEYEHKYQFSKRLSNNQLRYISPHRRIEAFGKSHEFIERRRWPSPLRIKKSTVGAMGTATLTHPSTQHSNGDTRRRPNFSTKNKGTDKTTQNRKFASDAPRKEAQTYSYISGTPTSPRRGNRPPDCSVPVSLSSTMNVRAVRRPDPSAGHHTQWSMQTRLQPRCQHNNTRLGNRCGGNKAIET